MTIADRVPSAGRGRWPRLVAAVVLLATGGILAACAAGSTGHPTEPAAGRASHTAPNRPASTQETPDADPPAPPQAPSSALNPVRVQIPSIGVSSTLQALGVDSTGALQRPSEWQRAGWYAGGVIPGEVGPAIIAGHVDSVSGPAVFYRLTHLKVGAMVYITRADGQRLEFVVDSTHEYPKTTFPTAAVYGPTSLPVLRLITCTGDFDRAARSYVDNLVVSTHLVNP